MEQKSESSAIQSSYANVGRRKYPFRIGFWMPENESAEKLWLDEIVRTVREIRDMPLHPIVKDFQDYVEKDATMYMQYTQMFTEVNNRLSPTDKPQIKGFHEMFLIVNFIMQRWAPQFNEYGLVGFPINAILNWSMGTIDGYAAFLNEKANRHWKRVLDHWGKYLESSASTYVLVDEPWGWFGKKAMEKMPNFAEEFQCDPTKPHYGFKSWDDFFTRKFREGVRPIAEGNNVIASACESLPFDIQKNIKIMNEFWIKEQKYSLRHMLNDDPLAAKFIGGTCYQAFLSAMSFHRWHSPVDGKVVKAYNIPGTYYSATLNAGADDASPNLSQGYICQVAARAVMFIEADNPAIGLMCFIAVGMSEVSTCEIKHDLYPNSVNPSPKVKKGDEIGSFHYGGSTHCLLFRKDVNLEWDNKVIERLRDPGIQSNILVNSKIATVS